jgi:hypothetical protein
MDSKLKKWIGWFEILHSEIQDLVVAKHTFQEVQKMIENNHLLHQHSSFYDYFSRTYVSHVLIGLRRQIKCSEDSISITRLFEEMIATPQIFQRSYYTEKYKGSIVEDFADNDFDKFAVQGSPHINPKLIADDLARLKDTCKRCEDFADKRIAHRDKREPKDLPTFVEVDMCIALLDELYIKYYLLFHASSMNTLLPTWQYDWQAIFQIPWIPSKEQ